jgi:hypothetical protein
MSYLKVMQQTLENVTAEKTTKEEELKKLEEEFANVKLNPYGITSIDFSKRQELAADVLKMEGVIMGITLAIETFGETQGVTA